MRWFRFYHDAIDDPKVQRLPGELFKFWVNVLCLASRNDERGLLPMSDEEIAFAVRVSDEEAFAMLVELEKRGLIDPVKNGYEIHNWKGRQFKSDNVAERVNEHRKNKNTDDVTLHPTLHETPGATLKPSARDRGDTEEIQSTDTEERKGRENSGADAPPPAPKKRATRIPEDFDITEDMAIWAAKKGIPPDRVESETEKFVYWYQGESGARATKLDWPATWKTWLLRDFGRQNANVTRMGGSANGRASPGKSLAALELEALEREEARRGRTA